MTRGNSQPARSPAVRNYLAVFDTAGQRGGAIPRERVQSARVYSRVLDSELWIAADEETARSLEAEIRVSGSSLAVLTADEAVVLGNMAASDAKQVLSIVAKIQRSNPAGARLRHVTASPFD